MAKLVCLTSPTPPRQSVVTNTMERLPLWPTLQRGPVLSPGPGGDLGPVLGPAVKHWQAGTVEPALLWGPLSRLCLHHVPSESLHLLSPPQLLTTPPILLLTTFFISQDSFIWITSLPEVRGSTGPFLFSQPEWLKLKSPFIHVPDSTLSP